MNRRTSVQVCIRRHIPGQLAEQLQEVRRIRCAGRQIDIIGNNVTDMLLSGSIYGPKPRLYFLRVAALWIDEDTYLEPDLMYISSQLEAKMPPQHWTRADIVVEIISPSNANYNRKTKSDTYRAMGVRELWLIDSDKKQVEVRSFEAGNNAIYKDDVLRSEVLPKLRFPFSSYLLNCLARRFPVQDQRNG